MKKLLCLHGIYYNWNKEKFTDKPFEDERQIGFSAQELEKLFPELVRIDAKGYKAVDYIRMTPVLVEAIKQQQPIIEQLNNRVDLLMKKIETVKGRIGERMKRSYDPALPFND